MPPMMPPGMPPAGGGGGGGAIAQVLQSLMSNPAAIKGMMNFMQGQPPTAGMPVPPSQGGALPPGMQGGPGPMMPQQGGGAEPPPDAAEAAAQGQMDKAGYTWDGTDAPTQNDIERLKEDPTAAAIKSFDEQFGDGMAEKYIGEGEGAGESEGDSDTDDSGSGNEAPEYDE